MGRNNNVIPFKSKAQLEEEKRKKEEADLKEKEEVEAEFFAFLEEHYAEFKTYNDDEED